MAYLPSQEIFLQYRHRMGRSRWIYSVEHYFWKDQAISYKDQTPNIGGIKSTKVYAQIVGSEELWSIKKVTIGDLSTRNVRIYPAGQKMQKGTYETTSNKLNFSR